MIPEIELHDKVTITCSNEQGEVIGIATYTYAENKALVRYEAADGRAVESWWNVSALTKHL